MFGAVDDAMDALYPDRIWGQPRDDVRFQGGIGLADGQALAEELAQALTASTFFREGQAEEFCDYIYILCVGREPSLIQIRDGGVPVPDEVLDGPIEELYLRVCLSDMARLATVQQVAVGAERIGSGLAVVERPRGGVYDAPLLPRMQRLVSVLPAYDILHVDFGDITQPPPGYDGRVFRDLYGQEPTVANYLFYPTPIAGETTTVLLDGTRSVVTQDTGECPLSSG
jgi:hypothetical protein